MVLAAKVFIVREDIDLDTIAKKLKNYKSIELFEYDGRKIELITEITNLNMVAESLKGIFSQDQILNVFHHGEIIPIPKTIVAPFIFNKVGDKLLLTILEKKERANNIANQLSKILFITTGYIVEVRIPPEVLKRFHEDNYEDAKVIFFDEVDIPNIKKLSLYGSELSNTTLYDDYCAHGKIWYVVVKSKKYGYIVGVTRNAVITVFSKIGEDELINYIINEIYPLIV
ncbi:MAG: hypothetical protein RMJ31_03520 [Nitrososphaerota archaeon]|nr:hypothetical protein [Nitrososphaerales archaeon]MDW8044827.1 hypothetical protein [Nitrososphaerota archaeon]